MSSLSASSSSSIDRNLHMDAVGRHALIQRILTHLPSMELIEQIQWVKKMQRLGVRYTTQTNGVLVNLKALSDSQLLELQPNGSDHHSQ